MAGVIILYQYVLPILEALPYLHTRVQVVENVIIFQFAMSIVIKVHSYLFPWMYPISSQDRRATGSNPNTS